MNHQPPKHHTTFKFVNCVTNVKGYTDSITSNWNYPISGRPSYILWHKLKRLKPIMYNLPKPLLLSKEKVTEARANLSKAQVDLAADRMNSCKIQQVKYYTDEHLKWSDIEDSILRQIAKIK